jgi:hypothetical protein
VSGRAVDTVLAFNTQAGAGAFPQALAAASGDSLVVRGTVGESKARLMAAIFQSNAAGQKFQIKSPLLHDNVTGLTFIPSDNPALFAVPSETSVELNELDTLAVNGACGAAYTITAGLVIAYDDVRGTDADLYHWHDIASDIKFIKSVEVSNLAIAVGAWTDTPLTNTEDQLHADKSYAVLGYVPAAACALVGVKGIATGNLRMCGPGGSQTLDLSDYYIQMSVKHNAPYIPVIQANDRKAVYVSQANGAAIAGAAAEVSLIVAELKNKR